MRIQGDGAKASLKGASSREVPFWAVYKKGQGY